MAFDINSMKPLSEGNLDPDKPVAIVKMPDGKTATVRTMSFGEDGQEVLIPTVHPDGYIMEPQEAIAYYHKTGGNFGKFDTEEEATSYAQNLHKEHEQKFTDTGGFDIGTMKPLPVEAPKTFQESIQPGAFPQSQPQSTLTPPGYEANLSKNRESLAQEVKPIIQTGAEIGGMGVGGTVGSMVNPGMGTYLGGTAGYMGGKKAGEMANDALDNILGNKPPVHEGSLAKDAYMGAGMAMLGPVAGKVLPPIRSAMGKGWDLVTGKAKTIAQEEAIAAAKNTLEGEAAAVGAKAPPVAARAERQEDIALRLANKIEGRTAEHKAQSVAAQQEAEQVAKGVRDKLLERSKPVAETSYDAIGEDVRKPLLERKTQLESARAEGAKEAYDAAMESGGHKIVDTSKVVEPLEALYEKLDGIGELQAKVRGYINAIKGTKTTTVPAPPTSIPDFSKPKAGLTTEVPTGKTLAELQDVSRFLGDKAYGGAFEGLDSITTRAARDAKTALDAAMVKAEPLYGKAVARYS